MKTKVAIVGILFAASLLQAQTAPAAKLADPKVPVTKPGTTTKAAPAKAVKPKEEPLPKIPGMVLTRPNGTSLGLTMVDGKYKLTFYDKKNKPAKVDVTRAVARWPNVHGPGNNITVLNPAGNGTFLLGAQFVRGPYAFLLNLTLLKGEGDTAVTVENYAVPFRG